jgi:hypothetical protein
MRKKRKLEYIRTKNKIRKGLPVPKMVKVSDALVQSKVDFGIFIYEVYPEMVDDLKKYWHLNFMPVSWQLGHDGDDIVNALQTLRIEFKHFKG